MPNRIILKRSSVAGKTPVAADLSAGELAINLTDKRLFSEDASGNIINITVDASHVTTGTLADARIASAATWNAKEPGIAAGTTAQYWRGDKSWQTLNSAAVGLGSVENKSSATIRGEITSANVTTALGFTPYNSSNPSGYITSSGSISGNAATASTSSLLTSSDNRTLAPSNGTAGRALFGFTSWSNNNTSPYADYLLLRSYTDATGGNDNLVMFRKDTIGMRIWQQGWGSSTAFATYKDVAFTDGTGASGTWGISITGSAATATTANALNTGNNYQVNSIGVGIAASGTAGSIGLNQSGVRSWAVTPTGGNLAITSGDSNGSITFNGSALQTLTSLNAWAGSANITTIGTLSSGTVPVARVSGLAASATTDTTNAANISSGTLPSARLTGSYAISITGSSSSVTGTVSASADQAIVNQNNGNAAAWYGRILSKNSTNDRAAFIGTYASVAGVFAHNNALTAWADLYINTVDGSGGGTVRMPSSVLINGNQALHAGNYSSYALPLSGGTVSGSTTFSSTTTFNSSPTVNAYLNCSQWFNITGGAGYGLYGNGTNGAHFYLNSGSYGPWKVLGTRNGWSGIEFGSLSYGDVTLMIGTNSNSSGFHNNTYGWHFYWGSGTIWMSTSTYGGGNLSAVLNSSNWGVYIGASALGLGSGNNVTFNAVNDAIGNLRTIVQNYQTAAYTLAATDSGKHIRITTGGVTVPNGVFSAGQAITIYNDSGSNQTITQGASVTMYLGGTATTGNRTLAQRGVATLLCVASNTFVISGAGLT